MFAALALLILFGGTEDHPTGRFLCHRTVGKNEPGSARLDAMLILDRTNKVLERSLMANATDYRATWDLTLDGDRYKPIIRDIQPKTLTIPKTAIYPITVRLLVDGVSRYARTYNNFNVNLLETIPSPDSIKGPVGFYQRPAIDFDRISIDDNIVGSTSISMTAETMTGDIITRRAMTVLDWSALQSFYNTSFVEMSKDAAAGRCGQIYTAVVFD